MNVRSGMSAAVLLAMSVAAGGCSSGAGGGEALCPVALDFHHQTYLANPTNAAVPTGAILGQGRYPSCDDGHGATGTGAAQVVAIPGVDPSLAVAVPSYAGGRYVWIEKHKRDAKALPAVLKRLVK